MTVVAPERIAGRTLIDSALFDRLIVRVSTAHGVTPGYAARIVDQALAFLGTSAVTRNQSLTPSRIVDIGWHTFILDTREYAQFCTRVAGRFIHHTPHDPPNATKRTGRREATMNAIELAGFMVDHELWSAVDGNCSQDDCSASGVDGNENRDTRTDRD